MRMGSSKRTQTPHCYGEANHDERSGRCHRVAKTVMVPVMLVMFCCPDASPNSGARSHSSNPTKNPHHAIGSHDKNCARPLRDLDCHSFVCGRLPRRLAAMVEADAPKFQTEYAKVCWFSGFCLLCVQLFVHSQAVRRAMGAGTRSTRVKSGSRSWSSRKSLTACSPTGITSGASLPSHAA